MALPSDEIKNSISDPDRISALHDADLLDTPDDKKFGRITSLVRRLLSSPVALVSLVDADRQFFKSQRGQANMERQADLTYSICKHVVHENKTIIVNDTRIHPLTYDKLAFPDRKLLAYLGTPIFYKGEVLGSLCAVDDKTREWTTDDITSLEDLAVYASMEIILGAQ